MRAFSDSTSARAESSSDLLMTCSFTSCSRRPSVSSASRSRASSSAAPRARRFELRLPNGERCPHLRVVELRQHLALVNRLAFLDEHLEHLAGHFRRDRGPPARRDVTRCVQHGARPPRRRRFRALTTVVLTGIASTRVDQAQPATATTTRSRIRTVIQSAAPAAARARAVIDT